MLKTALYRSLRPLVSVKNVKRQLHLVERSSPGELNRYFLAELLASASHHTPYYRELPGKKDRLSTFPLLNKSLIKEHFENLTTEGLQRKTYLNSSGGSTGQPQTFIQDMEFSSWSETAQEYYYRHFLQVDPVQVKKVILWGSERDTFRQRDLRGQLTNWLTNSLFLNTFQLKESTWLEYVEKINRYQPYFIRGYAGSLYQIARAIKKHNLTPHRPHFIYSSAEMLQDFMRKEIEEAFQAKVFNYYGSREVGAIAGECRSGHLHIFDFHNHVEVVEFAQNKPTTKDGRLLITNLHNFSMPLIRYEIGDTGQLGQGPCSCGSTLPWLTTLKGRVTDHFFTKAGDVIHGEYFTHLFYFREWVEEFQVNQLDYDQVEVLVVERKPRTEKDQADINEKIRFVLGKKCRIEWKFVSSIAKTPQGKHLFTRCLMKKP